MRGQRQERLRIAGAKGASAGQRFDQRRINGPGADGTVDQQCAIAPRRFHRWRKRRFEKDTKRREAAFGERDASRHGVAAALDQQSLVDCLANAASEIDAGN